MQHSRRGTPAEMSARGRLWASGELQFVELLHRVIETDEQDGARISRRTHRAHGYLTSRSGWVGVNTGADRGKRNRCHRPIECELQTLPVAGFEQVCLALIATSPDWSHRVDDVACGQVVASGQFCLAGDAAAQITARIEQAGSRGAVYCAIHAAATEQGFVCRVDHGGHLQGGNVALEDLYAHSVAANFRVAGIRVDLRASSALNFTVVPR